MSAAMPVKKRSDDVIALAEVFDEWLENLPPEEYAWAQQAYKNITSLPQVGELHAKATLVKLLMFYKKRRPR